MCNLGIWELVKITCNQDNTLKFLKYYILSETCKYLNSTPITYILVLILNTFSQDYQQNWCSWEKSSFSISIFYFQHLNREVIREKSKPTHTQKWTKQKELSSPDFQSLPVSFPHKGRTQTMSLEPHCFL